MGHAQRRVVSLAAKLPSVPLSSLRSFPPEGALATSSSTFSPEAWAALQPPPPSALSALSHRIGLGSLLKVPELEQACTHPSVLPFFAQRHPNQKPPPANGNLSTLGNSLLGLFASEFVAASYPHLPTRVVKAAVSAYVGPSTCANVAKEVGAAPLLRWHRTVRRPLCFYVRQTHSVIEAADTAETRSASPRCAIINTALTRCSHLPTELIFLSAEIRTPVLFRSRGRPT
jgi:large subunit ribosomal protein L44